MAFLKIGKKEKENSSSEKTQPKDTSKEQIPDELPALAQDVLNEAIPNGNPPTSDLEEIPDELPSLNIDIGETTKKPEPKQDILQKLKAETPEVKEQTIAVEEGPRKPSRPLSIESYFYKIADTLKQKKPSENILEDMKSYWGKQNLGEEELKTTTQKELESSLREKIRELQDLEANWIEQRRNLEHEKNMITSIEAEISIKAEELKIILDKLERVNSIYEKVKSEANK